MAFPSEESVTQQIEQRTREIVITHFHELVEQKYKRLLSGEKPTHIGKASELDRALALTDDVIGHLFDLASRKRK